MSSDTVVARGRVLRGADAARLVGATLDTDLSVRRVPSTPSPGTHAPAELREALRTAREEAARVGYEDGYEAGRSAAEADVLQRLEPARADLARATAALEAAARQLLERQEAAVADVERHVAELAVAVAEAVIGQELRTSPDVVSSAITRALQLVPQGVDAIVRVHPQDAAVAPAAGDRRVTLVADAGIEPGGCIVDAGPCRIDAQIAPALARVREALGA